MGGGGGTGDTSPPHFCKGLVPSTFRTQDNFIIQEDVWKIFLMNTKRIFKYESAISGHLVVEYL